MRETPDSAAALAARCRKFRRGSFIACPCRRQAHRKYRAFAQLARHRHVATHHAIAQRDAEALKAAGRETDLDAPRGLTAFFEWVALEYPQVACAMLARLMPQQQQSEVKVEHTYHTMEEIAARLRELGLEPRRIYPLLTDEKKSDDEVH
jgi:hypothetical protein